MTKTTDKEFSSSALFDQGLNLHAVFNLCDLPTELLANLSMHYADLTSYRQLILIANGGRSFWTALKASGLQSSEPVDDFTQALVQSHFTSRYPQVDYQILYPGVQTVDLQQLGELVGWHHQSPFRVGVNKAWGSWFAYRAVILADTEFTVTPFVSATVENESPCVSCAGQVCINHCPVKALSKGELNLERCLNYRQQVTSKCRTTCIARVACPVATDQRYSQEQIQYHYVRSLEMIKRG